MSKMSELAIDIEVMLQSGLSPDDVADSMGIPLKWVLVVREHMDEAVCAAPTVATRISSANRIW